MTSLVENMVSARVVVAQRTALEVDVTLRYSQDDPYAVSVVFPAESTLVGDEIAWVFGRDLLEAGLRALEGDGDVRLWPAGENVVVVELHAPEAVARVEFEATALRRFLWHTYRLVPRGEERLDLDSALSELFGGVQ